ELRIPPRLCQPLQALPFQLRCHSPLSVPRTKTSILPAPHDTALGSAVSTPPSDRQALHALPFAARCHSPLSVPRANTSVAAAPLDEASGPEVSTPPSGAQPAAP